MSWRRAKITVEDGTVHEAWTDGQRIRFDRDQADDFMKWMDNVGPLSVAGHMPTARRLLIGEDDSPALTKQLEALTDAWVIRFDWYADDVPPHIAPAEFIDTPEGRVKVYDVWSEEFDWQIEGSPPRTPGWRRSEADRFEESVRRRRDRIFRSMTNPATLKRRLLT